MIRECLKCGKTGDTKKGFRSKTECMNCFNLWKKENYRNNYTKGQHMWGSYVIAAARVRARKSNVPFDKEAIRELLKKCPEECPILGIPITINTVGKGPKENSVTLDRIIPEKGYVEGNMAIMSWKANRIKNNASVDDLRKILTWLEEQIEEKTL